MARTVDPHAATLKAWETRKRERKDESEGLGEWTPDGRWRSNGSDAAEKWGAEHGVKPGDKPAPFPVWESDERAFDPGQKDWWEGLRPINPEEPAPGAERVGDGPMKVPIADLIATQHVVSEAQITKIVGRIRSGQAMSQRGIPVVVRVGTKSFIYDGHHRASATKITGGTQLLAHVFEVPTHGLGGVVTGARY